MSLVSSSQKRTSILPAGTGAVKSTGGEKEFCQEGGADLWGGGWGEKKEAWLPGLTALTS